MSDPLPALARLDPGGWLVGGAVRARLLGRETSDYDVATAAEPRAVARALGRELDAHAFMLSAGFGAWRVVAHDKCWQVDILPLAGATIEEDLARRDFTVGAIAVPLGDGEPVDPFGGIADLRAGRLRMVSEAAFAEDPVRVLRLVRLACELELEPEPDTMEQARGSAVRLREMAGERVFAELKRVVASPRVLLGLSLLDEVGATGSVLPELTDLRGVQQSSYHHLDVADHTRAVLAETVALEEDPSRWFGEHAAALASFLAEPLADELTRGQALRLGALFHDIAKPRTRDVTPEGRITFIGHDASGAQMAIAAFARLRTSERLSEYVAALARHHLRLGFLVHEMPLSRRTIYRYLRTCEPVAIDVTLLSVADRLATRGRGSERAIERHLELARQLLGEALAWRQHRPRPPVDGHRLVQELGLDPGPVLGRLLAELEEASFAGELSGPEDAIEQARALLADRAGSGR